MTLVACGGGSGGGPERENGDASPLDANGAASPPTGLQDDPGIDSASGSPGDPVDVDLTIDIDPLTLDPASLDARYRVTLENFWGVDTHPQEFPDDAHLSLVAGAVHDDDTVFWSLGGTVSRGMEDIAEAGLIDVFLFDEVMPAIAAGGAASTIRYDVYTDPMIDGIPGASTFAFDASRGWERLTLATMLGPSPDWFVGVSGFRLSDDAGWVPSATIDLPLLDGGTKSDIVPVMGGPDIIPPEPIDFVAYDETTGTYLPSDSPEFIARLTLTRIR